MTHKKVKLISYPKKPDKVDFKNSHLEKKSCMKNVVECYKDFFGYFNAPETHGVM